MTPRRALIIGIAGQDGSFLAELLLAEGYEVFGVVRQPVSTAFENLEAIRDDLELMQADVLDELSLVDVLAACRPHEVYNLASPSFVPMSWQQPVLTAEFAAVGCTALLEAIRRVDDAIRFYQASSSEIFGEPREVPQAEETPLRAGHAVRRGEGVRALHHAELPAPLRAARVLRDPLQPRVAATPARLRHPQDRECGGGDQPRPRDARCSLGELDARRDWGYAGDYVRAMWLDGPAGRAGRLRDRERARRTASASSPQCAFAHVGLDWEEHVRVDDSLVRGKAELHDLVGDASKAREQLGWSPTLDFEGLVHLLVDSDLERLRSRTRARRDARRPLTCRCASAHGASRRRSGGLCGAPSSGVRTRGWPPHSRLFIGQEAAEWVLSYEARQLVRTAHALGIAARPAGVDQRRRGSVDLPPEPVHAAPPRLRAPRQQPRLRVLPRSPRHARDDASSTRASTRCAGVTGRSTASR